MEIERTLVGNNSNIAGPAFQILNELLLISMAEIFGKYLIIEKWLREMFSSATAGTMNFQALPSCRRCNNDFEKVQHSCRISVADKYSEIRSKIAGGIVDNRVFVKLRSVSITAIDSALIIQILSDLV